MGTLTEGTKVSYFNTTTRKTVTGEVIKLLIEDGRQRAIVKHTGIFKNYYNVNIGCFALTVIS